MKIQHTPAPFPSTILSLTESETFRYRNTRIRAVTITPDSAAPYTLSGESGVLHRLRAFQTPDLPAATPPLVASTALAEYARYATPVPRAADHPDAAAVRTQSLSAAPAAASAQTAPAPAQGQHLADPSGPRPTPAQQDSIRNSAQRTSTQKLSPQPQHLAAPPVRTPTAGRHRA